MSRSCCQGRFVYAQKYEGSECVERDVVHLRIIRVGQVFDSLVLTLGIRLTPCLKGRCSSCTRIVRTKDGQPAQSSRVVVTSTSLSVTLRSTWAVTMQSTQCIVFHSFHILSTFYNCFESMTNLKMERRRGPKSSPKITSATSSEPTCSVRST